MFKFIRKNRKLTLLFLIVLLVSFFLVSFAKDNSVQAGEYSYFNVLQSDEGYSNVYAVKSEYHKDKFLSSFEVTGDTEKKENVYGKGEKKISVYHVLNTDIDDLWGSGNKIDYDGWSGDIYGADFDNQKIGLGAIHILFTYYNMDGNPEYDTFYETDFLVNKRKGEPDLLFTIDENSTKECDVSIALFYKVSNSIGSWGDYFRVNFDFSIRNHSTNLNFKAIAPESIYTENDPVEIAGADLLNDSCVFNGFYIDYMGNQFYTTTVYRNNIYVGTYNFISVQYVYFSQEGKYEIINENAFFEKQTFYLTVDRYKPEGIFLNIDYNYMFSGWTRFVWIEPKGYEYRSSVTLEISYNGGEYLPYNGEFLQNIGSYVISASNAFYTIDYHFTIVEYIIPDFNYRELLSFNSLTMPTKFWAVSGYHFNPVTHGEYRLFSADDYYEAYNYALYLASSDLSIYDYNSEEEYSEAVIMCAESKMSVIYYDFGIPGNYTFDESIQKGDTLYLNNFTFKNSEGPLYSNKVYYLRQEDYPFINTLNLSTAMQHASVFEYNVPVREQLLESGTYLILDTNIFGQSYFFKAVYVAKNETVIDIAYSFNGLSRYLSVKSDASSQAAITPGGEYSFLGTVDEFSLKSLENKYDKYSVIKISYLNLENVRVWDYYIESDNLNKIYSAATTGAGIYLIECYDRNGLYFSFEIIVRIPYDNQVMLQKSNYQQELQGSFALFFPKVWIVYAYKNMMDFDYSIIENDDTYYDMNCIYFNNDPGSKYTFFLYDEFGDMFVIDILI